MMQVIEVVIQVAGLLVIGVFALVAIMVMFDFMYGFLRK